MTVRSYEPPAGTVKLETTEIRLSPLEMEPASKTRFEMLLGPKEHEMHHRAQLMVLQRMIGQVPHLTRLMQERMAQVQAGAAQAR